MELAIITASLMGSSQGEQCALANLAQHVERVLHSLVRIHLKWGPTNREPQPTTLINKAPLRLIGQSETVQTENPAHFFAISARIMRVISADYAWTRSATRRGGRLQRVALEGAALLAPGRAPDFVKLSEALGHLAIVDARKQIVIESCYFGRMTRKEVSTSLALAVFAVNRDVLLGEAWLRRSLAGEAAV